MTNERCDFCGANYDSDSEGHEHFEDGSCECRYCQVTDELKGKKFCSSECEYHFIVQYTSIF